MSVGTLAQSVIRGLPSGGPGRILQPETNGVAPDRTPDPGLYRRVTTAFAAPVQTLRAPALALATALAVSCVAPVASMAQTVPAITQMAEPQGKILADAATNAAATELAVTREALDAAHDAAVQALCDKAKATGAALDSTYRAWTVSQGGNDPGKLTASPCAPTRPTEAAPAPPQVIVIHDSGSDLRNWVLNYAVTTISVPLVFGIGLIFARDGKRRPA